MAVNMRMEMALSPKVPVSRLFKYKENVCFKSPRKIAVKASENDSQDDLNELKDKYFPRDDELDETSPDSLLDGVNPIALGRKARQAFDQIWAEVSNLTAPTKSFIIDDVLVPGMDFEFEQLQGPDTKVLVVGSTGRVGRVLCRKLLLRGYKVKCMVRKRNENVDVPLPSAVEIVYGDVGESTDCAEAVRGVNKVVYCAGARTTFTAELLRVEEKGVANIAKALQDEFYRTARKSKRRFSPKLKREVADFSHAYHQLRWDVTYVGMPDGNSAINAQLSGLNTAIAEISFDDNIVFQGSLFQRGAIAEMGCDVSEPLPGGDKRMQGCEGLVMRIKGDGHNYSCRLETSEGDSYSARFPTRMGFLTIRLPFNTFRPDLPNSPKLDPSKVVFMAYRYEQTGSRPASSATATGRAGSETSRKRSETAFELEVDWIKALPGGEEPDVVLVSCVGRERPDMAAEELKKLIEFKRRGEEALRFSGLGYTIIRPGPLVEEPGGYKALVFDQGDRITQTISAADVADVSLKALSEPAARNKTFDVCYETPASEDDMGMLELVARVPDSRYNYLKAAVGALVGNT